jgi:putative transposase
MLTPAYPRSAVCRVLDYARSSSYYRHQEVDDSAVRIAVEQVAGAWPTYGSRRITAELRRQGMVVNRKRVSRVMRELGLQTKTKRRKRQTTNSQHTFPRYDNLVSEFEIEYPDQVWVADITYIHLRTEFVYLAVVMDVYTRCIRGWHLGRNLDADLTLIALQRALLTHQPQIHHSDQGVQYAATSYTALLESHHVAISMAEVGAAWQNGYAERLIRTIKEEEVELTEYRDFEDAFRQIGRFLDEVYMQKRIHSSLGYLTPAEHEQQWAQAQARLTAQVC